MYKAYELPADLFQEANCPGLDYYIKQTFDGIFTRLYYPFGACPTYLLPDNQVGMMWQGWFYISPKGRMHPEVKADLEANWLPVAESDRVWKAVNITR
jgi:hypothetical protein